MLGEFVPVDRPAVREHRLSRVGESVDHVIRVIMKTMSHGHSGGDPTPRRIHTIHTPGIRCHSSRSPRVRRVGLLRRGWLAGWGCDRPGGKGIRLQRLVVGPRRLATPRHLPTHFLPQNALYVSGERISVDILFSESFAYVVTCVCRAVPAEKRGTIWSRE